MLDAVGRTPLVRLARVAPDGLSLLANASGVVPVEGEAALASGAPVLAGGVEIGRIGSVAGTRGLAMVRLDRAAEAAAKGQPLLAGGTAISLREPARAALEPAPESPTSSGTVPGKT